MVRAKDKGTAIARRAQAYADQLMKQGFDKEAAKRHARRRYGSGCFR